MPDLYWDIEARSAASLQMCGAWRYAADPTTSVLCVCYAVDDGAAQVELCRACRHHIARRTDHRCHQIAKGPPPSTKASPFFFARGPLLLTMEFAPVLLRSHPARRPAISELFFGHAAAEFQPCSIEEGAHCIRACGPDHDWGRVEEIPEVLVRGFLALSLAFQLGLGLCQSFL